LRAAPADVLPLWARTGAELAERDYTLGVEYLRCGPEIVAILPASDLKAWGDLSLKLVTPNDFGKPDYIAALTYLRTSPLLLGDLPTTAVRRWALTVADAFAGRSPERA